MSTTIQCKYSDTKRVVDLVFEYDKDLNLYSISNIRGEDGLMFNGSLSEIRQYTMDNFDNPIGIWTQMEDLIHD